MLSGRGSDRRPAVVTAAVFLLVMCAAFQAVFFFALAASGTSGGFLTQMLFTGACLGLVCFAVAAMCVWRGWSGARVLTWLIAIIAAPSCGILTPGVVSAVSSLATTTSSAANDSTGLISDTALTIAFGIVFSLSALAAIGALALLSLPSSGRYFRRQLPVRPAHPVGDHD